MAALRLEDGADWKQSAWADVPQEPHPVRGGSSQCFSRRLLNVGSKGGNRTVPPVQTIAILRLVINSLIFVHDILLLSTSF